MILLNPYTVLAAFTLAACGQPSTTADQTLGTRKTPAKKTLLIVLAAMVLMPAAVAQPPRTRDITCDCALRSPKKAAEMRQDGWIDCDEDCDKTGK